MFPIHTFSNCFVFRHEATGRKVTQDMLPNNFVSQVGNGKCTILIMQRLLLASANR